MEGAKGGPIRLTAGKTVSRKLSSNGRREFVFTRKVKVTRGSGVLTCDRLVLIMDEQKASGNSSEAKGNRSKKLGDISIIKSAKATGDVKAVWNAITATADELLYDGDKCEVELRGGPPRLWQGSNVIRAKKILLYPCEERYELIGGSENDIEATITPGTSGKETK